MDTLRDKIAGAIYGVAVGDAMGGPLEFMSKEDIEARYGRVTDMIGGGWLNLRPGETTDDTAMTLAVAEGIMEAPDEPTQAIGRRFIEWANSGPKDIGGTCAESIRRAAGKAREYHMDTPDINIWWYASQVTAEGRRAGGNGALMRSIYPALYYTDEETAIWETVDLGKMTHWDDDSGEACKLYAQVVHYLISEAKKGNPTPSTDATLHIYNLLAGTRYDLDAIERKARSGGLNPSGYVVDSLECALFAFWNASTDFWEAIIYTINQGGDADTIAAICGGLAGAFYGFSAIPKEWVAALSESDRSRLDAAVDAAVRNWEA